ncbi:MAG TPA: shikimate kinase [Parafilimonas sp.]|nr:shikimate kinase [Parafilimonas sp.]
MQQQKFSYNPSNPKNRSSVFLLGLMGSGKSFWADKLGRILNIPFFHLDDEIERAEQKTIAEIFDEKGEDYFRQKETEILKSFSDKNNFILSVGGGTPCFNNNMDWMNENGITIWIDEPIEIIKKRLLKEKSHRPLIANVADEDLYSFLSNMREKRSIYYAKAKHHLKQDEISEQGFLKIILNNE